MPRAARVVHPGHLYHITQRGNNRQYIFNEDNDYVLYLKRIEEYRKKSKVDIYAFCLMGNHVHFILKPYRKDSLAKMFKGVNMRYAKYYQKKTSASGHVWQGRFYSCLLSGDHIKKAIRYVEKNPVRAEMVAMPWHYPWSSARAHLGKRYHWITLADTKGILGARDWRAFLREEENNGFLEQLRAMTKKNLALGSSDFILKLEKILQRKIIPSPVGRPRKKSRKIRVRP